MGAPIEARIARALHNTRTRKITLTFTGTDCIAHAYPDREEADEIARREITSPSIPLAELVAIVERARDTPLAFGVHRTIEGAVERLVDRIDEARERRGSQFASAVRAAHATRTEARRTRRRDSGCLPPTPAPSPSE